ncbi:SRPBCC family protein [Nocardioides panacisoli]|uniref:SRPBCC family protein n=1 Tax=Nocardioides panacisoli TaxID=627624 RepID=UPI001C630875|nr:SRPBCC family protein [Nocardioides panacisoli]QYJ05100.1 SRPBCC family protein [Nocardioides panacisoli]
MPTVQERVEIDAPVTEVFAYVDDASRAHEWLVGLTRIEPVGSVRHGVGAQYDGTVRVGVALDSRIECTAWEQDRLIVLQSVDGIENTQRWEFAPLGEDRCEVRACISFEFPGGPAGRAIARVVRPLVGGAVQRTAANLVGRFARAR